MDDEISWEEGGADVGWGLLAALVAIQALPVLGAALLLLWGI